MCWFEPCEPNQSVRSPPVVTEGARTRAIPGIQAAANLLDSELEPVFRIAASASSSASGLQPYCVKGYALQSAGGGSSSVSYWYPNQIRVDALSRELSELSEASKSHAAGQQEYVPLISAALSRAKQTTGFPTRQLRQWVWVASQFRLHGDDGTDISAVTRGALTFLIMRLARGDLKGTDVQDLNWVLDSTIQKLVDLLGTETPRSQLSDEEIIRIKRRLDRYDTNSPFDPQALRNRIQEQLKNLGELATDGNLSTISAKVEALFAASNGPSGVGSVARAALLYLADIPDVVPDSHAFLGLLDDIYVIEWAYSVVESHTRCLPLLEALLERWPFVGNLPLIGPALSTLDRYSQYVACACLYSLFETKANSLLVVRESAAHCMISTLMVAVESARREAKAADSDIAAWNVGQPITISDGTKVFKAIYGGLTKVGATQRYRIQVRDDGWITVDTNVLPYIARSQVSHAKLSRGNEILQWLKERPTDPLVYLTGSSRQRLKQKECVLLVGPRHKLDEYFQRLKPLGQSVAALFGGQYVTVNHQFEALSGSSTDTPTIYACSDADVALDLIKDPPEHVATWHVIVDGARNGRTLLSSLASSGNADKAILCIVAQLHERELTQDIAKQNIPAWYLEDQHVEVPPLVAVVPKVDDDILVRVLCRQQNHWVTTNVVHTVRNSFLESVFECIGSRVVAGNREPTATALNLSLSAFLQRATSYPLKAEKVDDNLVNLARSIASQASVLRQYDRNAQTLFSIFNIVGSLPSFDREEQLERIVETLKAEESVAVLCRSDRIAAACSTSNAISSRYPYVRWMNLERLRQCAPFDRVIVAGWIDKMAMRELSDNGYGARLDLLLLPFERKWFDATVAAARKWERQLEIRTTARVENVAERLSIALWRNQADGPGGSGAIAGSEEFEADSEDLSEMDQLEARAIEALHRSIAQNRSGQTEARAQLVLFEEAGSYAYLPPTGRVIVLSQRDAVLDEAMMAKGQADRLLFRSVSLLEPGMVLALPIGTDRDLIDARADQFIPDSKQVRLKAALWKGVLRRCLNGSDAHIKFARLLAEAGQKRDPGTVKSWMTHTQSLAPMNYPDVIPLIARLTGDTELKDKSNEVIQSIDLIYRARSRAAEAIVRELFAGTIDQEEEELRFELDGAEIRYLLRRVRRMEGIHQVPTDLIGKVGSMIPQTEANSTSGPTWPV